MLVTLFLLEGSLISQKVANIIGCPYHKECNERFSVPGLKNPVFCPVVRFSNNNIFDIYSFHWISEWKNFPGRTKSVRLPVFAKIATLLQFRIGNIDQECFENAYCLCTICMSRECQNPVFCPLSGFLKNTNFKIYLIKRISWCKIFPDK